MGRCLDINKHLIDPKVKSYFQIYLNIFIKNVECVYLKNQIIR